MPVAERFATASGTARHRVTFAFHIRECITNYFDRIPRGKRIVCRSNSTVPTIADHDENAVDEVECQQTVRKLSEDAVDDVKL